MAKRHDILREFDEKAECFSHFTDKLRGLVSEIIATTGLQVHSITSRTKARASLQKKLRRGGAKYPNIESVTDICGVRIITYFEDDVDKVAGAIESEFDIDWENSVDKRDLLDPDRFGYLSLHYIVFLPSQRARLLEYRRFEGLKAEIQVRSILQHAWAEIEHDLGYKTVTGVPRDIRREFSRLAGLLEIADREFTGIRDRLSKYEIDVIEALRENPEKVLVDKASLTAFVANDKTVSEIDNRLGQILGIPVESVDYDVMEWYASRLQLVGIGNFAQLRDALANNLETIVRYGKERISRPPSWHGPVRTLGGAASLTFLIQILAAESEDSAVSSAFFNEMRMGKDSPEEALLEVRELVKRARESGG